MARQKWDEPWGKGEFSGPELPFGLLKSGTTTRCFCGKPGGARLKLLLTYRGHGRRAVIPSALAADFRGRGRSRFFRAHGTRRGNLACATRDRPQPGSRPPAKASRRIRKASLASAYPTVTDLARLRGLSMARPSLRAVKYENSCATISWRKGATRGGTLGSSMA